MRRTAALLTLLALLTLAACGDDDGGGPGGEGGGEVRTTPVSFGDGSEVWLRIESGGGYVPEIVGLRDVPVVLLFDDGRLVRRASGGSEDDEVIPDYEAVQLDESEVAEVLADVEALVNGPEVGEPEVTDLATTTIEVTVDGDTDSLSVYALGFDEDAGLDDDELDARHAIEDQLEALGEIGDGEPYVPEEWLVVTAVAELETLDVAPWPLEPGRIASDEEPQVCTRIGGDEVAEVLDALTGEALGFASGSTAVEVALRPVLTGDEDCDDEDLDGFVER